MGKREEPLTFKQEKFCKYYVDTEGNASEAYRMSYNTSNMKPETIWSAASRLLANSKVSTRINEIKAQRAKESEVERKTVERVLMDIVLANPDDLHFVDPATGKTKMRTPSQLPKRARNALKKIQNKRGEVTYEFNGKTEAARILGAWNGWEADKNVNIKGGDGNKVGKLSWIKYPAQSSTWNTSSTSILKYFDIRSINSADGVLSPRSILPTVLVRYPIAPSSSSW